MKIFAALIAAAFAPATFASIVLQETAPTKGVFEQKTYEYQCDQCELTSVVQTLADHVVAAASKDMLVESSKTAEASLADVNRILAQNAQGEVAALFKESLSRVFSTHRAYVLRIRTNVHGGQAEMGVLAMVNPYAQTVQTVTATLWQE